MTAFRNFLERPKQLGTAAVCYGYIDDFHVEQLSTMLNIEEAAKAERFRLEADRRVFIVGRAILKFLLSPQLCCDPAEINFDYNPHGKPMFRGISDIQFNVSHTVNIVLWGFTVGQPIGVDVEHIGARVTIEALKSVCTQAELSILQSIPEVSRQEYLVQCWTQKEAMVKALGDTSLSPVRLSLLSENWLLQSFELPRGFRGAIAVNGQVSKVEVARLDSSSIEHLNSPQNRKLSIAI